MTESEKFKSWFKDKYGLDYKAHNKHLGMSYTGDPMDFVDNYNKPLSKPEYKFGEDRKLKATLKYIQSTYDKH